MPNWPSSGSAAEFDVDVLLLLRHPANVLASWMEVNLKDARYSTLENRPDIRARYVEPWGVPLPGPDPVERMSWMIGLLTGRHRGCHRPVIPIGTSAPTSSCAPIRPPSSAGSTPTSASAGVRGPEEFLDQHNAPGSGFTVKRVAVRAVRLVATTPRRRAAGHPAPDTRAVSHCRMDGWRL